MVLWKNTRRVARGLVEQLYAYNPQKVKNFFQIPGPSHAFNEYYLQSLNGVLSGVQRWQDNCQCQTF